MKMVAPKRFLFTVSLKALVGTQESNAGSDESLPALGVPLSAA